MNMAPSGTGRLVVASVVIALLAVLVWWTMEPGRYQQLTWVLLGFFAMRVVLGWARSRKIENVPPVASEDRQDVR